jgi:prevent-host-death family protein
MSRPEIYLRLSMTRLTAAMIEAAVSALSCRKYSNAVYHKKQELNMTRYTTSDLSRKSGDIIAEALRKPVTITQRNKPRLVLLNIEDYRRLTARGDARKTGTLAAMSDQEFAEFRRAVDAYAAEGDEG